MYENNFILKNDKGCTLRYGFNNNVAYFGYTESDKDDFLIEVNGSHMGLSRSILLAKVVSYGLSKNKTGVLEIGLKLQMPKENVT